MDKSCGEKCERARKEGLFLRKNEASTYRSYVLASFFCPMCSVLGGAIGRRMGIFSSPASNEGACRIYARHLSICILHLSIYTLRFSRLHSPLIASIGDFFEPRPVQTAGLLVGEGCSREGSAPCCGAPPLCFGERLTYRGARCEK